METPIPGEAGTTGLQIRSRLANSDEIVLLSLHDSDRKSVSHRREALNSCDIAIFCLPDQAAREVVELVVNPAVRVIDASTAHRTAPDWTYGFPEMCHGQVTRIRESKRVSNPGCYPIGAIAILRPLIDTGLLPAGYPVSVSAVSGYSGVGARAIEAYEDPSHHAHVSATVRGYGLALEHKHIPEMECACAAESTAHFPADDWEASPNRRARRD